MAAALSPRSRLIGLWILFLLTAAATGAAIHRLYARASAEVAAQGEGALRQARAEALERIRVFTDETRRAIITELAGFHTDGLGGALRRWDAANELITGTFEWGAPHGWVGHGSAAPSDPAWESAVTLWREFQVWRQQHPAAFRREAFASGPFLAEAWRTLETPEFPASALRYQAENLDLLRDGGQHADPWAGWAGNQREAAAPWIFWYRAGPDSAVRGCLVDVAPLVRRLQEEISGGEHAILRLVPVAGAPAGSGGIAGLPGYALAAELGGVYADKAAAVRMDALVTGLLCALFLLGVAGLMVYTRRESRDAGRKVNFVTQVSHELRTPLTSIRMFADMLGTPELPEGKRLKFADNIAKESARLSLLIERLLAFNTLEKGGRVVAVGRLEVGPVIEEVASEMAAALAAAGLSPRIELPAGPLVALADHSTLKQALLNLLENAAKYAPGSGEVVISVRAEAGAVFIRVVDAGPGLPAAIRPHLFEPFVQGGQTLTTKSPGVGLGLSLARGLLRQIGGDLTHVTAATGAVFEIRLPLAPPVSSSP